MQDTGAAATSSAQSHENERRTVVAVEVDEIAAGLEFMDIHRAAVAAEAEADPVTAARAKATTTAQQKEKNVLLQANSSDSMMTSSRAGDADGADAGEILLFPTTGKRSTGNYR